MERVYVDNAATTAMSDKAISALNSCLKDTYGNPSSLHTLGNLAAEKLSAARRDIAQCLGARTDEIYFTSGGTEADNQAIMTAAEIGKENGKFHIISQKTEHHAVLNTLSKLEKQGFEITLLDVDSEGKISAEQVENVIREDTVLVTIMTANNETGTIMPIKEIVEVCHEKGVLCHTDAVQAVGHIYVDVGDTDCDMLSLSAHKFHGAKGVGVLYCKRGITPYTLIEGGGQEHGVRSGTENVGGICAMAEALKEAIDNFDENMVRVSNMRNTLEKQLLYIPHSQINGSQNNRLPSIVNISFKGIESESLLLMLDNEGICCSAGSACNSESLDPSYVLKAMGISDDMAMGAVRFSLSEYNTIDEINYVVQKTTEIVKYLRSVSPVWENLNK